MFGDHMMKLNVKNVLNFLSLDSHVDKQGYLHKKGEVNKGWQRRWFLLKGNLLFYYQNAQDTDPIGLIVLEGCSINPCSTDSTTFSVTFQNEGARTYHLCADNDESCTAWINALQRSSYGYLRAQVERLHIQVAALEKKKDLFFDHVLSTEVETDEASTSKRANSLAVDSKTATGQKSPKQKHNLRAFTSPLSLRKKVYSMDNKRSPSRHRKKDAHDSTTCRTFAQLHADFAPGKVVIIDPPTPIRYNTLSVARADTSRAPSGSRKASMLQNQKAEWYVGAP